MSLWHYAVAGLSLEADQPLAYLSARGSATRARGSADVLVRFTALDIEPEARGWIARQDADWVDLAISDRLRFRIRDGARVTVDARADISAAEIQTYLFGPVFAALHHQRGNPPWHAGAVTLKGGAVAVAGPRGAGKSTTLRALVRGGARLLCDDQMVLCPHGQRVLPGVPAFKLWRESAAHFRDKVAPEGRVAQGVEKFHVPLPGAAAEAAMPLRAICILGRHDAPEPVCRRLSAVEAVVALTHVAHHVAAAQAMGRQAAIFQCAARLADRVPVFLLRRSDDLCRLDAVADLVRAAGEGLLPARSRA